jgi:rRNA maturation protein Nop10
MNRPPQTPQTLNIDMKQLDDVKCDKCGNFTFDEVTLFKKVSALISPSGKEGLAPIPTFACHACGNVNAMFLPPGYAMKDEAANPLDRVAATTLPPTNKPKLTIVE